MFKCGCHASLLLGTHEPDQTLSDLDEDFAYYKLFLFSMDNMFYATIPYDKES